jgi:hypothetical protein
MDVRNRSLARTFALRGTQIERQFWGYTGSEAYDGFFSRQTKLPLDRAPEPPPLDPGFIWRWRLPFGVGYTLAIDLLFSVVGVYSLYVLIRG